MNIPGMWRSSNTSSRKVGCVRRPASRRARSGIWSAGATARSPIPRGCTSSSRSRCSSGNTCMDCAIVSRSAGSDCQYLRQSSRKLGCPAGPRRARSSSHTGLPSDSNAKLSAVTSHSSPRLSSAGMRLSMSANPVAVAGDRSASMSVLSERRPVRADSPSIRPLMTSPSHSRLFLGVWYQLPWYQLPSLDFQHQLSGQPNSD
eukprot:scaffold16904_cov72-Phaeocystis_antarctica.AAC.4